MYFLYGTLLSILSDAVSGVLGGVLYTAFIFFTAMSLYSFVFS